MNDADIRPPGQADRTLFDGVRDGEARKLAAHALLDDTRPALIRRVRRALLRHLLAHGTGTIDDVRPSAPLPAGVNPVALGAAPGPLARAGIIARAEYVVTERPEAHSRPVSRWRLIDREAAEQWLHDNPESATAEGVACAHA